MSVAYANRPTPRLDFGLDGRDNYREQRLELLYWPQRVGRGCTA